MSVFNCPYDIEVYLEIFDIYTLKVYQDSSHTNRFNVITRENGTGEIKVDTEFILPGIIQIGEIRESDRFFRLEVENCKKMLNSSLRKR